MTTQPTPPEPDLDLDPDLQSILSAAIISPEIHTLRPDYRALLIAVSNITPGPSTPETESLLVSAESHARTLQSTTPVPSLPHIAAWRETYKSFGAKPSKHRNSLEALTRRIDAKGTGNGNGNGLPRVNRITDVYNALSVLHQIPFGGEDLDRYTGPPRLIRAQGDEKFTVMNSGVETVEHPEKGEVVWVDDAGVTCRRWNWRQGVRTAWPETTTRALFILDALGVCGDGELEGAGRELVAVLRGFSPGLRVAWRLIGEEGGR